MQISYQTLPANIRKHFIQIEKKETLLLYLNMNEQIYLLSDERVTVKYKHDTIKLIWKQWEYFHIEEISAADLHF